MEEAARMLAAWIRVKTKLSVTGSPAPPTDTSVTVETTTTDSTANTGTHTHTHTQIKVCVTMWCLCWLFVSIKTLTGCWDVASVLVLHTCVESTTSVPGVGGGRPHVDHVTVTQIRASTPTVTRPADTVAARQAATHTNTCCRLSPSTADLYWECWAACLLTSWLHLCTYMTANGN